MFPFEFLVRATPVSLQTRRRDRLRRWKAEVRTIAEARWNAVANGHGALAIPVSVTIFYFTAAPLSGDVDNVVKPILDALTSVIYPDDRHVERVVAQKIEPSTRFIVISPSDMLTVAVAETAPIVYVRVDADLGWRTLA